MLQLREQYVIGLEYTQCTLEYIVSLSTLCPFILFPLGCSSILIPTSFSNWAPVLGPLWRLHLFCQHNYGNGDLDCRGRVHFLGELSSPACSGSCWLAACFLPTVPNHVCKHQADCWLWFRCWKWGQAGDAGKAPGQTWQFSCCCFLLLAFISSCSSKSKQMGWWTNGDHIKDKKWYVPNPLWDRITKLQAALILKYIHTSILKLGWGVPNTLWKMFTSLAWGQWKLQ